VASAGDYKRSKQLALDRYEEGYDTYLDVLEAQRSLYAAQDSLAQSDQQIIDDLIAIYKALGGGWQTDPQTESAKAVVNLPPVPVARVALPPLESARGGSTGGTSPLQEVRNGSGQ